MRIDLEVRTAPLILKLRNGSRRLAFAVVNAINATARKVQEAERAKLGDHFEVRKRAFLEAQAAIIKPFASVKQGRPFAEVAVGQKPRLLLSTFEKGGTKTPAKGREQVAVPITGQPARPSFSRPVDERFTFRALNLRKSRPTGQTSETGKVKRTRRAAGGVRYGERGTYQVPGVGVFQRDENGESRLLYAFVEKPRLDPMLDFVRTAETTAATTFAEELERETLEAMRRAGFQAR